MGECLKRAGCEMVRCDPHRGAAARPSGGPGAPPSFPSLPSGGNRTERRASQKLGGAIFTALYSSSVRSPRPRRPVPFPGPRNLTLGQLSPEVMENIWPAAPATRPPCPRPRCCWRHSRPLSRGTNSPNGA